MPLKSSSTKAVKAVPDQHHIQCSAQQSRFHAATLDSTLEIDLHDVSISIGETDIITNAHLRLKEGVKYALIGRNGTGKTTLLTAINEKLIPGASRNIRILLLSQVEDATRAADEVESEKEKSRSVLEHVVRGDKERLKGVQEMEALTRAVESTNLMEAHRIVAKLLLEKAEEDLVEARKIAARRSGTRGKEARAEELKAEDQVRLATERLGSEEVESGMQEKALEMLQDAQMKLELLETDTTDARAAQILSGLGFSQEMMDRPYSALSGGWRSRCSLATSLLVRSDILLLDEPSNFLDLEAIIWLEAFLSTETRTVVLVSHDQEFINDVAEETILIRGGSLRYFEGNPRAFEINEKKERKRKEGQKEAMDKKKEHIEKSIQQGIASAKKTGDDNRQRMVKSRQRKLDERFGVEQSAKGGRFKLNRDLAGYHLTNRAELFIESQESRIKITIPNPEKLRTLGDLVHFEGVEYRFPRAKKALLEEVSFTVGQTGRVAFVGANGQGKSTLAKLILGTLKPTKGTITRHPLLKIGCFDQHSVENLTRPLPNAASDRPATALSYFMDHFEEKGEKLVEQEVRACLGSFGLQGKTASDTPLTKLSGGQKVRLAFALIVFRPPSLLLLDEISTHLDVATLHSLALGLKRFSGAIVLITHDRWFSRIVIEGMTPNSILAESGDADGSDFEDSSSDEDEDGVGGKVVGQTFRVGAGKVKLQEGGMPAYVAFVERKLERRRKAEAAALAAKV